MFSRLQHMLDSGRNARDNYSTGTQQTKPVMASHCLIVHLANIFEGNQTTPSNLEGGDIYVHQGYGISIPKSKRRMVFVEAPSGRK